MVDGPPGPLRYGVLLTIAASKLSSASHSNCPWVSEGSAPDVTRQLRAPNRARLPNAKFIPTDAGDRLGLGLIVPGVGAARQGRIGYPSRERCLDP